jgi:hypothetical protein
MGELRTGRGGDIMLVVARFVVVVGMDCGSVL